VWDMWEHWNGALHMSAMACQQIMESQVNDKIHSLYELGPQALPCDALLKKASGPAIDGTFVNKASVGRVRGISNEMEKQVGPQAL